MTRLSQSSTPWLRAVGVAAVVFALMVSPAEAKKKKKEAPQARSLEDLQIVDCLLPGQLRQLGRQASFVTARRPIRTTTIDCEIRGGEYTSYDRSSYASALATWLPAAEAGDPAAQTYVGEIFEKGLAAKADYEAAAQWYEKAAVQGFSRGQINLGHLYERGLGVVEDKQKALTFYRQAAGISEAVVLDQSEEVAALRSEVEQTGSELLELRQQLGSAQDGLEAAQQELESSRREAEELRRQLEEARSSSASTEGEADLRVSRLARELQKRQERVVRQESAVESLSDRLAGYRQRLAQVEKGDRYASVEIAGPTLEIVRPDVLTTRGPALVTVPEGAAELEISGRVAAPAGLQSLTLGELPLEPDAGGFFVTRVPVAGSDELVFRATDRRGQSVRATLVLVTGPSPRPVVESADLALRKQLSKASSGKNHALVISVSDYQNFPNLRTASADSLEVRRLLQNKYGFAVTLLEDPTSVEIFLQLDDLRRSLGPEENLLIYYAGHGKIGADGAKGFWIPSDGDAQDNAKWIPNEAISDMLDILAAKHVLVVSDSCYSGTLTRSGVARLASELPAEQRQRQVEGIAAKRSRTVLTSGGLQPVLDQGGGQHSLFAKAFLSVLEQNEDVLLGVDLYREVAARVRFAARSLGVDQRPDYAPIRFAGHEAGDFALVPRQVGSRVAGGAGQR